MIDILDIVFDGPPGPTPGRFVEVENAEGHSVRVGEWLPRPNGMWALRLTPTNIAFSAREQAILRVALRRYKRTFAPLEDAASATAIIVDELLGKFGDSAPACPKGEECALNKGAAHCFSCRRNWPRDETWDMPFEDRPAQ